MPDNISFGGDVMLKSDYDYRVEQARLKAEKDAKIKVTESKKVKAEKVAEVSVNKPVKPKLRGGKDGKLGKSKG